MTDIKKYGAKYYQDHKQKILDYNKDYRIKNRDKYNETMRNYRHKQKYEKFMKFETYLPDQVKTILKNSKVMFINRQDTVSIIDVRDIHKWDNIILIWGQDLLKFIFIGAAKIQVRKYLSYKKENEKNLVDQMVKSWIEEFNLNKEKVFDK